MRPEILASETHKLKFTLPDGKTLSFYVTIGLIEEAGVRKPWEVFINVRDAAFWEHFVVATVGFSRQLQTGTPMKDIVADLKQIHSPTTGHNIKSGWSPSVYYRIGDLLERYA